MVLHKTGTLDPSGCAGSIPVAGVGFLNNLILIIKKRKMEISALASGSSGNCFYVGNGKGLLVDAGISCKQIEERLKKVGKNPEKIQGILITHEHTDHIRGADVFARRYQVPIFATKKTILERELCSQEDLIKTIKNNQKMSIAGMDVEAFPKPHKAQDPVSFNIIDGRKASIITDIGYCNESVIKNVSDSNFLCIETNHDLGMLENGPYPLFLKKWIGSDSGHLSNLKSALCILEHGNKNLKHIMLSHLSENNNHPQIALNTFKLLNERKDLNPELIVSGRQPSKLIKL